MRTQETRRKAIFETLRAEIRSGRHVSSERFPSETALARRFACSRQTVVHALLSLEDLGLVCRRRGAGTFLTKKARRFGASIGLILPGIGCGEIFPPISQEISRLAQKEGMTLLFGGDPSRSAAVRAERTRELARQFVEKGVAGVIFQPMEFFEQSARYNQEVVAIFTAARIPVVLIDCDIVPSPQRSACDVVGVNNFEAGRRLADYLHRAGARRIRFVTWRNCANSVRSRARGVCSLLPDGEKAEISLDVNAPDAVRRAFAGRNAPDAVVCGNDTYAARLIVALRALGKRVPEDVQVVGFDDVQHALLVEPPLTTVHQPCEDIARLAFRCLTDRMEDPTLPPRECLLDAPLVVRRSTRPVERK